MQLIRVTCDDPVQARKMALYLRMLWEQEVSGVSGSCVFIPWDGDAEFVCRIFQAASRLGFMDSARAEHQAKLYLSA